jgi:Raf kinase inhibitor-like YbhB/YbcL family protein
MIATRGILVGTGLALLLAIGQPGCRDAGPTSAPRNSAATQPAAGAMVLTSSAFKNGEPISKKYTGEGEDISPPLAWAGAPAGTKQFALIMDDPDAEGKEPWVHWVVPYIGPAATSMPEATRGMGDAARNGVFFGTNSFKKENYGGPFPPVGLGVHHYHFKLYALDVTLVQMPATYWVPLYDKAKLLKAMSGHILATAELVGTYEQK